MAYKRIYDINIKKLGLTGIALIFGIFIYLGNTGDITITGYSGDMKCAGTIVEPCYAYLNFTANKDIYIYPTNDTTWAFNVTPEHLMKSIVMQRSWGTGWRTIDLSKTYTKDVKYAIKFSNGQNYYLKFIGYKNNINDTIKWGFGKESLFNNDSYIDPAWLGYSSNDFMPELIYNKADITGGEALFKYCNPTSFDIDYNKDKIKFGFNKVKGDFDTFEVMVGTSKNVTKNITTLYSDIIYLSTGHYIMDNTTTYFVNDSYKTEWNETKTIIENVVDYEILKSPLKKLKSTECKYILIKGTWNAGKEIAIDWIPETTISNIIFKQDKWAWWNVSWKYVRPITITNSSVLNDYQVLINITNTTNMNTTGQDIRFTYNDNTTTLNYWIENWSTNNAQVWVKTNQSIINMWYGNPAATNTSNYSKTFLDFNAVPALQLWYAADKSASLVGMANNTAVTNWSDLSGNNRDATGGTANFRTGQTDTNDKPAVYFDGSDVFSNAFGVTGTSNWTHFIVFSMSVGGDAFDSGGATNARRLTLSGTSNIHITGGIRNIFAYGDIACGASMCLGTERRSDSIFNLFANGLYNQSSYGNSNPIQAGSTFIGDLQATALVRYTGNIMEIAQYNTSLDNATIYALNRGLGAKYRLTVLENITTPTASIGAEETLIYTITLYLNGTSADRFYELGNPVNITACSNTVGVTVYINTTHPSFTNPIATNTIITTLSYCEQETATTSTACGGLNTGNYLSSGGTLWYDGDWNTATSPAGTNYVNYTKPINLTTNSTNYWEVKDGSGRVNLTIPQDCLNFNTTTLLFKINGSVGPGSEWLCNNGTWKSLRQAASESISEEKMWWNITTTNTSDCATYLWNISTSIINQFNDTSITQNHSANNISGISINSVSDLRGAFLYLRGYPNGSSWSNITIDSSINTNDTSGGANQKWNNFLYSNDSNPDTYAYQIADYTPSIYSDMYENYTWNSEYASSKRLIYSVKVMSAYTIYLYFWNYSSNSWGWLSPPYYDGGIATIERELPNASLSVGKPIWIAVTSADGAMNEEFRFYEGKILYENETANTQYPENLSIDIGGEGTIDYWLPYSYLKGTEVITTKFKTNNPSKSLIFSRSGTNVSYIDLPCGIQPNSMILNVSGGGGTQNLNKVDSTYSNRSYIYSIENSSNNFYLYLPDSSTVSVSPTNITLTGKPYYEPNGTLSGGYSGWNYLPGVTYKTTTSKAYGSGTVTLIGSFFVCEYGCDLQAGTITTTLVGTSGDKGSCTTSVSGGWGRGWGPYSCSATISSIYEGESLWVTSRHSAYSYPDAYTTEPCCDECTGTSYKCTGFSGLNQYNTHNATNTTIWYNGTTLEYQYLPELNSSITLKVNLSSTNMNSYLSTCTQDPCPIPYTMKTTKRGNITISGVNVDYTNSISNITLDIGNNGVVDGSISGNSIPNNNITIDTIGLNAINTYMSGTCLNKSLPLVWTSETAGTLSMYGLVLNYSINPISLNTTIINNYVTKYMSDDSFEIDENRWILNSGTGYISSGWASKGTQSYLLGGDGNISKNVISGNITYDINLYTIQGTDTNAFLGIYIDGVLVKKYNQSDSGNIMYNETINMSTSNQTFSLFCKATGFDDICLIFIDNIRYTRVPYSVSVPISYKADNWGILNTYSLSIDTFTDYNYTFTGWSDAITNMTKIVKLIWSNYSASYPNGVSYFRFKPTSVNDTNVTPVGQTSTTPMFNITGLQREQPFDIWVKYNATPIIGVNFSVGNSSNISLSYIMNNSDTYVKTITNITRGETEGLWFWQDFYNVNTTLFRYWKWNVSIMAKCSECV